MLPKQNNYSVGIYMRLSKDDERAGESLSIENQRAILTEYVSQQGWTVYNEYVDDGISGVTFERTGLQRMLDDAKAGRINLIICKDLSRFGRDYLMTGQYIEMVLPELSQYIKASEQKNADTAQFIGIVRKYSEIPKLTPEIMHEFVEKIVVHAPDKSSGHRTQQIDIHFRFNVAVATAVADSMVYDKKRKAA